MEPERPQSTQADTSEALSKKPVSKSEGVATSVWNAIKHSPSHTKSWVRKLMKSREGRASAASLVALIIGIIVVSGIRDLFGIDDSVTIVALLLVPLVVYSLASGQLREFTAPGGLALRFFQETVSKPLKPSVFGLPFTISASVSDTDMEQIVKEREAEMHDHIYASIRTGGPRVLTMVIGNEYKPSEYQQLQLESAINMLSELPNFRYVVIVNVNHQVIAYAPPWALETKSALMSGMSYKWPSGLLSAINKGAREEIIEHPATITKTVSIKASNIEALEEMQSYNLDAIVVVDEDHLFKGVIDRHRIVSQMMLALAKSTEEEEAH